MDVAAVVMNYGTRIGQPQPMTVGLGREMGLEYLFLNLFRHAMTIVVDFNFQNIPIMVEPA